MAGTVLSYLRVAACVGMRAAVSARSKRKQERRCARIPPLLHGCDVLFERVSNLVGDVLRDENDGDVLARGEVLERLLDLLRARLLVHLQEVLLPAVIYVAHARQ